MHQLMQGPEFVMFCSYTGIIHPLKGTKLEPEVESLMLSIPTSCGLALLTISHVAVSGLSSGGPVSTFSSYTYKPKSLGAHWHTVRTRTSRYMGEHFTIKDAVHSCRRLVELGRDYEILMWLAILRQANVNRGRS